MAHARSRRYPYQSMIAWVALYMQHKMLGANKRAHRSIHESTLESDNVGKVTSRRADGGYHVKGNPGFAINRYPGEIRG
jgi:hypothetical protein